MNPNVNGFFPEEVVLRILARLPVKSLLRTKCVCKLWHKLICEKYFTRIYNQVSVKNPMVLFEVNESCSESKSSLICVDNLRGVSEISLDFIKDRVKVRASCNGLLCCSSIPDKGVYYVCNPMTREYKLLPRSRERHMSRFYPDGEAMLVGLACNLLTQQYNVVLAGNHRAFAHRAERTFICLIYDSVSGRWKKFVSVQDYQFTHMNKNQVVFVNEALHWLTETTPCLLVLELKKGNGMWKKIQLPNEVSCGAGKRIYLLELDGCLSLIQISEAWMVVWVMKNYGTEEWHIVDRVSLRCIRGMVPGVFPISQTGEYIFLATHKQILVYQRNTKEWKEMYSARNTSNLPLWFYAHSFRNTLFSCH
ncbi:PREDICTED: F-box protein At5g49610 [Ipomoea nil]|uniref:F-box protein At5g49610 n=1 Tax=Ipomoea nil TaxID=35883 RepID=UPI0009018613|nr:PREDICTED: F-box protein At5g49610 [Ipomoea nil]